MRNSKFKAHSKQVFFSFISAEPRYIGHQKEYKKMFVFSQQFNRTVKRKVHGSHRHHFSKFRLFPNKNIISLKRIDTKCQI